MPCATPLDAPAGAVLVRGLVARLRVAQQRGVELRSNALVLAVWRDSSGRQALLSRLLPAVDVGPIGEAAGRAAGVLICRVGTAAPLDPTVVLAAHAVPRAATGLCDHPVQYCPRHTLKHPCARKTRFRCSAHFSSLCSAPTKITASHVAPRCSQRSSSLLVRTPTSGLLSLRIARNGGHRNLGIRCSSACRPVATHSPQRRV